MNFGFIGCSRQVLGNTAFKNSIFLEKSSSGPCTHVLYTNTKLLYYTIIWYKYYAHKIICLSILCVLVVA